MLKRKPTKKKKNPCPPWVCGFNPSTKKTRFKRNPKYSHKTETEILDILENQWNSKSIKTDWLKMEDTIRLIFALYDNDLISETRALGLIGETVAAFTRRGEVMEKQLY